MLWWQRWCEIVQVLGTKCAIVTKASPPLQDRGVGVIFTLSAALWGSWKGLPKKRVPKCDGADEVQAPWRGTSEVRDGFDLHAGGVRIWSPSGKSAATIQLSQTWKRRMKAGEMEEQAGDSNEALLLSFYVFDTKAGQNTGHNL